MTAREHTSYQEEIGAYLLGALTDLERQAFEQHLDACADCRAEIERLRPAADSLPRSVPQVEPPASLKASLMKVVDAEARDRPGAPVRRSLWQRLFPSGGLVRPAFAAGAALAIGLLAGIGIAQLGGDDERTVTAMVSGAQAQRASAELQVKDGEATLVASGLDEPSAGRVYKVWVMRRGEQAPRPNAVFLPDNGGAADVPVQGALETGDQVLVTAERDAQARAPEGTPFISASVPA
jgi:anti-sigma-K factor RskA